MSAMTDSPGIFRLLSLLGDYPDKSIGVKPSGDVAADPLVEISDIKAVISAVRGTGDFPFDLFGLECTLQPGVKKVDFSFSLTRGMAEKAIARGNPFLLWHDGNAPAWPERMKGFLMQWLDARSLLYHSMHTTYFELDTSSDNAEIPGLFVRLQSSNKREEWYEIISLAVLYAAGIELTDGKREMIRNCCRYLASASEFFHLGIMFSRNDCPIKLVAMHIGADDIIKELRMLGIDLFECVSESDWESIVRFSSGKFGLSLDFTDRLHKRIGIEIGHSDKDGAILDWMVEKGCCSTEKRDTVLDWEGEFTLPSPDTGSREIVIRRIISHFKLVLQPGMPVLAKVYLGYACG